VTRDYLFRVAGTLVLLGLAVLFYYLYQLET
jgi:hypothetical protein